MTELFDDLLCVQTNQTVSGVMLINADGIPIKTTLDNTSTVQVEIVNDIISKHFFISLQYGDVVTQLTDKAQ